MLSPNVASARPIESDRSEAEPPLPVMLRRSFGLDSLARHKWLVVSGAILGLLAGLVLAGTRKAIYTAWMELLVYNRQIATGPAAVVMPGRVDIPLLQNQTEFLRSRVVLGKVIDTLDLTKDPEFFYRRPDSILTRLKELIAPPPPKLVDDRTVAFVETLAALRKNIDVARVGASHIVRMDVRSTDPRKAVQIANEVARTYLQERKSRGMGGDAAIRELYQGLGPSAYVVSEVQPPIRASGLSNLIIVLGFTLAGLCGGAVVAVLRDVLSNNIRNPEQLEYFLGLPCLGAVATVPGGMQSGRIPGRVAGLEKISALLREERSVQSLGITSVLPGDGVTTIALNIARCISGSGRNVLLVDCSSDQVRGRSSEREIAVTGPVAESGDEFDRCATPVEALDALMRWASESYDAVIVDLPSLVCSVDARVAARSLDGLLLLVKSGNTDCELARQALESAAEARAKFMGAILNMIEAGTTRSRSEPTSFEAPGALSAGGGARPRDEMRQSGKVSEPV